MRAVAGWRALLASRHRLDGLEARAVSRDAMRTLADAFQALAERWQRGRHEALLIRLSALYLRKSGLRSGVSAFRAHACGRGAARARRGVVEGARRRLQQLWLRRWCGDHRWRRDLRQRRVLAAAASASQLLQHACQAWAEHTKVALALRRLTATRLQARRRCAASAGLGVWRARSRESAGRRRAALSTAASLTRQRRLNCLSRWHQTAANGAALRAASRRMQIQHAARAMWVWKQQLCEGRARDACSFGAVVIQRFRNIVHSWRREARLLKNQRGLCVRGAEARLRSGVAALYWHGRRRRQLRAEFALLCARSASRLASKCVRAWRLDVQCTSRWRACSEAALRAACTRRAQCALLAWRGAAVQLRRLQAFGGEVGRLRARGLAARALESLRRRHCLRQLGVRAARREVSALQRAAFAAWRAAARAGGSCRRALVRVSQARVESHGRATLHVWREHFEARRQLHTRLGEARRAHGAQLLRRSCEGLQRGARAQVALRAMLARVAQHTQAAATRWGLRRLALWCVLCTAREGAAERAALALRRAALRHGLASLAQAVGWQRSLESRAAHVVSSGRAAACRAALGAWTRARLLLQRQRLWDEMALAFRLRRLRGSAWAAWASLVRALRDFAARLQAARHRSSGSVTANVL